MLVNGILERLMVVKLYPLRGNQSQLSQIQNALFWPGTEGTPMTCSACDSDRLSTFNGEIAIHFPGLEGLNEPIVWVFPKVVVCLNCGLAQFAVPELERSVLARKL